MLFSLLVPLFYSPNLPCMIYSCLLSLTFSLNVITQNFQFNGFLKFLTRFFFQGIYNSYGRKFLSVYGVSYFNCYWFKPMLPTSKYIYDSLTNIIVWTKSEHRISAKPNLNRNHDNFMSTIPGRWDENLGIFSMLALLRKMRLSFADKNKIAVHL